MNKKIILFLSNSSGNGSEAFYDTPIQVRVKGMLSSDAPVRYLIQKYGKEIDEVLCIVTKEAKVNSLPHFQALLEELRAENLFGGILTCVPLMQESDSQIKPVTEVFIEECIPKILSRFDYSKEQQILLELTGGLRNDIIYLMLLSRILSYIGITICEAVYSNYNSKTIENVTPMLGLFDIISGMQELVSFGSVKTLQKCFPSSHAGQDLSLFNLLTACNQLNESISLCQTKYLPGYIENFRSAVQNADKIKNPLMQAMIPAFLKKFGKDMSVTDLIRWYVKNDMFQQALTMYTERIPGYLCSSKILSRKGTHEFPTKLLEKYQDKETQYVTKELLLFSLLVKVRKYVTSHPEDKTAAEKIREYDWGYFKQLGIKSTGYQETLENFKRLRVDDYYEIRCNKNMLHLVLIDYCYIKQIRNIINHAVDNSDGINKPFIQYLELKKGIPSKMSILLHTVSHGLVSQVLHSALVNISNAEKQVQRNITELKNLT